MGNEEQMPKTLECCGKKPKRCGIQKGYRDEINAYELKCRVCDNRVYIDNDSNGEYQLQLDAVKKWNELILNNGGV